MAMILDTEVTLDNVESVLSWCARNQGDDFAPPSQSWGFSAAAHFLNEVKDSPLYVAAQEAFTRFLREGGEHEARFAASLSNPAFVPADAWSAALKRNDIDEDSKHAMRFSFGMGVQQNRAAYDPRMRDVVGRPGWQSFVGAFAYWDHAWLLDNLAPVLQAGYDSPAATLMYGVRRMNRTEALRFRRELTGRRDQLGDALLDPLLEFIDKMLADDEFQAGDGSIRWLDA